jgi:hypothetical protein
VRAAEGPIGAAMVYEVRGLGIIVRCPSCDNALTRLAHNRGRYLVDLRGAKTLHHRMIMQGVRAHTTLED